MISSSKTIYEGFSGLHFYKGKLVEVLSQGKHRFWGPGHDVVSIDLRSTNEFVGGQEVTTKDGGSLKVSLLVSYRISDPMLYYRSGEVTPVFGQRSTLPKASPRVHFLVQTALRDWTYRQTFLEAFESRANLGADVLPVVSAGAKVFGVVVESLQALDVSMVGALRAAYADLLKTKIEGETALARARNESATMRNLLNTARLVREHPGLLELRVLATNQRPKVTFVVGGQSPHAQGAASESDED